MSEPVITNMEKNEYTGQFTFDSDTGYTYNASFIEFVAGVIQLVDQGGGVYPASGQVTFPILKPDRVRKWWRFTPFEVLNSQTIKYKVSFSNDGIIYGSNPPDYNDSEWYEFDPSSSSDLTKLRELFETSGIGNDEMKIRVTLESDTTGTPQLHETTITFYSSDIFDTGSYDPIFTNRQDVSTLGQVPLAKVNDVALKDADYWVIAQLKNEGIDYTLYIDDESLKLAARYRCLCILSKSGVVKVVSGPLTGVSIDGISESWGAYGKSAYSQYYSEGDWCDMAGKAIKDFIDSFRVGEGSADSDGGSPGIKTTNYFRSDGDYSLKYRHRKHWR